MAVCLKTQSYKILQIFTNFITLLTRNQSYSNLNWLTLPFGNIILLSTNVLKIYKLSNGLDIFCKPLPHPISIPYNYILLNTLFIFFNSFVFLILSFSFFQN